MAVDGLRRGAGQAHAERPSAATRRAASAAGLAFAAAERLTNLGHELEVALHLARLDVPLSRQVDGHELRDAARPRAHDDDPRREEDGLGDGVGDEDDGRAGALPDAQEFEVHALARHLVEGPEGLVHEQQGGVERQGPGDGRALLHPARKLPGVMVGEVLELDQAEHLLRLAPRAPPCPCP